MLLFFAGKPLEHAPPALVRRQTGGPCVEFQPAPLRGNGNAQGVAGKNTLRRFPVDERRLLASTAFLTGTVDLDDRPRRGEVSGGGDVLDHRFDVRAEELGRLVALLADQMEVPRMPIGWFEPRATFAEVHLSGYAGSNHPLQRAIDRRAPDPRILLADEIAEFVRAQVTLLARKDIEDAITLAGALAARRPEVRVIR